MAPRDLTGPGPAEAILADLRQSAHRYDFFQAVRLLEAARPAAVPLGTGADPTQEALRFRAKVGLEFSSSDVLRASAPEAPARAVLEVAFMGLAGAEGPLPAPYCELVLERSRPHGYDLPGMPSDDARDFLDIFNHRLISLFYRGRKKHHLALGARAAGGEALLEGLLFELIGFPEGRTGLRASFAGHERVLLRYAGLLAGTSRSMAGLVAMLSDALGVSIRGAEGRGRWLPIDARHQTRIGLRLGCNQRLGQDTVLGTRAWEAGGAIALTLGPLAPAQFQALLPGGQAHALLTFLTRFYLREDLDVEVRLELQALDAVSSQLARLKHAQLSRTAWLRHGQQAGPPRQRDAATYLLPRWHELPQGDGP